jgi:hypothetical protein
MRVHEVEARGRAGTAYIPAEIEPTEAVVGRRRAASNPCLAARQKNEVSV